MCAITHMIRERIVWEAKEIAKFPNNLNRGEDYQLSRLWKVSADRGKQTEKQRVAGQHSRGKQWRMRWEEHRRKDHIQEQQRMPERAPIKTWDRRLRQARVAIYRTVVMSSVSERTLKKPVAIAGETLVKVTCYSVIL